MNNTVLRLISVLLGLAAVVVAVLAFKLSQAPAPAPQPVSASSAPAIPLTAVVVTTKAIKAGQALVAADVAVKGIQSPPAQAYTELQEVIGRVAITDIAANKPMTPAQFAADSISYLLKPGERAVAIQTDEVIGVGAFVKPGEHVDVLGYIPSPDLRHLGTADVVVQDARLLSIGDYSRLDMDAAGKAGNAQDTLSRESGVKASAEVQLRRQGLKSAVIAVKEADVNRLMLAASVGQIRLALRPPRPANDPNAALLSAKDTAPKTNAPLMTVQGMTVDRSMGAARGIVIQDGAAERVVDEDTQKNGRY